MAFVASRQALRPAARRGTFRRPAARGRLNVQAGLFDFLKPKSAAPTVAPRAREIVDELVELCEPTEAGLKVSVGVADRVEELVDELQQFCIKNPVKSDLLWGNYEVLYTSKPKSVAGPFRSGPGLVLFPGQKSMQMLEPPNQFTNNLEFKTLGFLSGSARQFGELEVTSGDTFKVVITRQEIQTGAGLSQAKDITAYRNFQVLYLDDTLRVTRFLPAQEGEEPLRDDEREGGQKSVPVLFVFRRLGAEGEEEPDEGDEGGDEVGSGTGSISTALSGTVLAGLQRSGSQLLGRKKLEGSATLTERQVMRQLEEDSKRGGTGQISLPKQGKKAARAAEKAAAQKQKEGSQKLRQQEAARAAERAAAEKQAAAEKERRVKEAAAEKERKEKEAAIARQQQAAIKEQLAALSQELKEKAAAKKDAVAELRAVERANGAVLKAAAVARSKVEAAASSSAELQEALEAAKEAQAEAVRQLKESEGQLREAEQGTKKVLVGAGRK